MMENDMDFDVVALGSFEEQRVYKKVPYCGKWSCCSGLYMAKKSD